MVDHGACLAPGGFRAPLVFYEDLHIETVGAANGGQAPYGRAGSGSPNALGAFTAKLDGRSVE